MKMVCADLAASGVIFTLDTESGFRDVVFITGAWGLGENIVRGEGEITFRELLRALETQRGYDRIAGLSYRTAGGFCHNPARGVSGLEDGEIRPPRRDARVLKGYTLLGRQVDVIETSRGCTFDCSFCSIIAPSCAPRQAPGRVGCRAPVPLRPTPRCRRRQSLP